MVTRTDRIRKEQRMRGSLGDEVGGRADMIWTFTEKKE